MKRKFYHILFWFIASIFLILFTGNGGERFWSSAFTVGLMLPVAIGTSYTFNYYLIPKLLFQQKQGIFALYSLLTIALSIYLEMMVVLLTFIFVADYETDRMNPLASDVMKLAVGLYMIVFLSTLIYLIRRWSSPEEEEVQFLTVRSNRETRRLPIGDILYVESLDNYVKIHLNDEQIITKEKISGLEQRLPDNFLRIHRSFLVNTSFVQSFTREKVRIHSKELPISRTYKSSAIPQLEQS